MLDFKGIKRTLSFVTKNSKSQKIIFRPINTEEKEIVYLLVGK